MASDQVSPRGVRAPSRAARRRAGDASPVDAGAAFRDLIVNAHADLSPQQRVVADFLLEHLDEAALLSLPELAERSGISEATVVRFARRLGFSGFSELRLQFLQMLHAQTARRRHGVARSLPGASGGELVEAVLRRETENIHQTFSELDLKRFRSAAKTLHAADHVYLFGLGISAVLADLARYWLVTVGLRASVLSGRVTNPEEEASVIRRRDVLMTFSFPPYSRATIDMVQNLKRRGVRTIVISDRYTAPAALAASVSLTVRTQNVLINNAIGAVSLLLNALVTQTAIAVQGNGAEALSEVNRMRARMLDLPTSESLPG